MTNRPGGDEHADELAVGLLLDAGAVLASSLELRPTLAQIARLTVPRLADLCVIDLRGSEGSIDEVAVASSEPSIVGELEALRRRHPLDPAGHHPVARVIRSGEAELLAQMSGAELASFAQGDEHARFMLEHGYRSAIVAPLRARGHTLGALSVLRLGEGEPYDETELALAGELARRAALAIDNARLFSELSITEQRLQAILENLAEAITIVDERGHTVFANRAAGELLGLDSVGELLDGVPGQTMARFQVLDETGRELGLADMPARRLFTGETPEPLLVRNIVRATGEERWLIVRASPIRDPGSGRVLLAANVLENVTVVKRAQLADAFMAQAGRVLSSSLDYGETLRRVARLTTAQIADWCYVDILRAPGELERVAVHHADPAKRALVERLDAYHPPTLEENRGVAEVLASGEGRLFENVLPEMLVGPSPAGHQIALLGGIGARDVIIVPLAAPTHTIGTITLISSQQGRRLTEEDLALAERLGRRAGAAVESSRLYTERSHIATVLQQALLPESLPAVPGFELAASYRAAGELNEVGGDFYDVCACGPERWVVMVGDVRGKGPVAAGVTALARHTLRALARLGLGPRAMLEALNEALREHGPEGDMCTVCLVVLEPGREQQLTIALAGHPPPLLARAGGEVIEVGAFGTVLGVVDELAIIETRVRIEPGETLVMFTDGLPEAARGRLAGPAVLAGRIGEVAGLELGEMLAQIEAAAVSDAEGEPRDDIALLGLRCNGGQ